MATQPRRPVRRDYTRLREGLQKRFPSDKSIARQVAHFEELQKRRAKATEEIDIVMLDQQINATKRGLWGRFRLLRERQRREQEEAAKK